MLLSLCLAYLWLSVCLSICLLKYICSILHFYFTLGLEAETSFFIVRDVTCVSQWLWRIHIRWDKKYIVIYLLLWPHHQRSGRPIVITLSVNMPVCPHFVYAITVGNPIKSVLGSKVKVDLGKHGKEHPALGKPLFLLPISHTFHLHLCKIIRIYHNFVQGQRNPLECQRFAVHVRVVDVAHLWHEDGFPCLCTKSWLIVFLLPLSILITKLLLLLSKNTAKRFLDRKQHQLGLIMTSRHCMIYDVTRCSLKRSCLSLGR